jgi:hypothetical protein
MLNGRFAQVRRSFAGALSALVLGGGLCGCSAGGADSDAAPEPSGVTCSLAITLTGVAFEAKAADTKACASLVESGPGMDLTFIPLDRTVISAFEISAPTVEASALGMGLPGQVTIEHTDGRTSHPGACRVTILENRRLGSEMLGERYTLRGTGTCGTADPLTRVGVSGPFTFTSSTLWARP